MKRRTSKDVRKFGNHMEFIEDSTSATNEYGMAEFSHDLSTGRVERFDDHDWISSYDWPLQEAILTAEGKGILMKWKKEVRPEKTLEDVGAYQFIDEGENENDLSVDEIGENEFRGIELSPRGDQEDVPRDYDYYEEQENRAGMTCLDVMTTCFKTDTHMELVGHMGTGKTSAARFLAQKTKTAAYTVNFSEEVRMSHLFGHFEVESGDEGGTDMDWVDGSFTQAARDGGMFIAEEHDMASGDVTSIFHNALEGEFRIPETGEKIDVHDDFLFVAIRNPDYAGSTRNNIAYEDRLQRINFGYHDEETEIDIVIESSEASIADRPEIRSIVKIGREIRDNALENDAIRKPISPRSMIRAADFIANDIDPNTACKLAYADRYSTRTGSRTQVETWIENSHHI